ncbi:MAG: type II toxin-antitoxin system HicA family toxin [Prevotellaceae bacterium]|nr:type II toxin-antitoxin system HicA family toxin [Prevotellaceae bacterium]MCD8304059.1 type II toxin-antitoxin system HicA family toxin [Prevotellaceae bacterium]
MRNLSNITLDELRRVLQLAGLAFDGVSGGHEKWSKAGMTRPVIFQTHKEPVPEFIVRNIMRDIGMNRKDFISLLESL